MPIVMKFEVCVCVCVWGGGGGGGVRTAPIKVEIKHSENLTRC